jgi:hypothetical protein
VVQRTVRFPRTVRFYGRRVGVGVARPFEKMLGVWVRVLLSPVALLPMTTIPPLRVEKTELLNEASIDTTSCRDAGIEIV